MTTSTRVSGPSRLLLILLALALVLPMFPGVASSAEKVDLRLNLEPGDTFKQKMEMEQLTDLQAPNGQQMLEEMLVTFETTTEVTEAKADGTVRLTVTNDRIVAEFDGQQGSGVYDSDQGGVPTIPNLIAFAAMAGKSFSYDLSADGKVSNVEGFDGLADEMVAGMPMPDMAKDVVKTMMDKQLNNETMGQMMEANHGAYPEGPVEVGDAWDQNIAVSGIVPMEMNLEHTLKDVSPTILTVAMKGKVSTPEGAQLEVMPGMAMQLTLKGEQEGSLVYDRESGWLKNMETQQSIQGQLAVPNPQGGEGFSMPMAVDTRISLETLVD